MDESQIKSEVWATVQQINRSWTSEKRPDELAKYFHKNMVALTPSDQYRLEDGAACLAGWKFFAGIAEIHSWKETDERVDLYSDNNVAVVTYYYTLNCVMNGQNLDLKGRDMMVLVNENGRWLVVADQFSPFPQKARTE